MAERTEAMQSFVDGLAKRLSIPQEIVAASDHPYSCRCGKCLAWWRMMGPDPDDDRYGPFTEEEVNGR